MGVEDYEMEESEVLATLGLIVYMGFAILAAHHCVATLYFAVTAGFLVAVATTKFAHSFGLATRVYQVGAWYQFCYLDWLLGRWEPNTSHVPDKGLWRIVADITRGFIYMVVHPRTVLTLVIGWIILTYLYNAHRPTYWPYMALGLVAISLVIWWNAMLARRREVPNQDEREQHELLCEDPLGIV